MDDATLHGLQFKMEIRENGRLLHHAMPVWRLNVQRETPNWFRTAAGNVVPFGRPPGGTLNIDIYTPAFALLPLVDALYLVSQSYGFRGHSVKVFQNDGADSFNVFTGCVLRSYQSYGHMGDDNDLVKLDMVWLYQSAETSLYLPPELERTYEDEFMMEFAVWERVGIIPTRHGEGQQPENVLESGCWRELGF